MGVLFFILIDILSKAFDDTKDRVFDSLTHHLFLQNGFPAMIILILGVAGAYLGLVFFEKRWIRTGSHDPKSLALIIAIGIGLHNFSEGLAIGQELMKGAMALGFLLVVGFALHNATEGFGIISPLAGEKPSLPFLFWLGMIGGGPTVIGTVIGESFKHPMLETFCLALASGAIFYVIGELSHIGRSKGSHVVVASGMLVGLFLAFGSDVLVDAAQSLFHH